MTLQLPTNWTPPCGERERRRTARTLRDAIIDARRPRSSNPLVLAGRTTTLTKGAARALIVDQALATGIATTLAESEPTRARSSPCATCSFPSRGATLSAEEQERAALHELIRAAGLLGIDGGHQAGRVSR